MWRILTRRQFLFLLAAIACGIGLMIRWQLRLEEEIQGTAKYFGDECVIIDDGFRGDTITWVIVRNWPGQSSPEERLRDIRCDQMASPVTVLMPNGHREPVSSIPHVYFFDGRQLTMFPVKMTANDITELQGHFRGMTDYREMLRLLKRYEIRN
jgi:hypothetical protein